MTYFFWNIQWSLPKLTCSSLALWSSLTDFSVSESQLFRVWVVSLTIADNPSILCSAFCLDGSRCFFNSASISINAMKACGVPETLINMSMTAGNSIQNCAHYTLYTCFTHRWSCHLIYMDIGALTLWLLHDGPRPLLKQIKHII